MASMRFSIGVVVVVIINLIMVVIKVEALIKDFVATWWPPWDFPLELLSPEVPQVFAHPPKMKSSSRDCKIDLKSWLESKLAITMWIVSKWHTWYWPAKGARTKITSRISKIGFSNSQQSFYSFISSDWPISVNGGLMARKGLKFSFWLLPFGANTALLAQAPCLAWLLGLIFLKLAPIMQ